MTTKTSRRAVLAGVAALPALSLPVIAAEPDPAFAAINRARVTYAQSDLVLGSNDDWDSKVCADANHASNHAHNVVFKTVPTTRAGAAALIAYAFECAKREGDWETAMGAYGDNGGNNGAELLESLTEFLRAGQAVQS